MPIISMHTNSLFTLLYIIWDLVYLIPGCHLDVSLDLDVSLFGRSQQVSLAQRLETETQSISFLNALDFFVLLHVNL